MALVPMVIEQTARGERAFDIFSRLVRDNIIFIGSPIDDETANLIVTHEGTDFANLSQTHRSDIRGGRIRC